MNNEENLDEILMWLRFMNIPKVYNILETNLDTDEKKIAYNMSDGENTTRDIAKVITPTHTTIARWWKDWYRLGIAEAIGVQRGKRAKRLFDLEDFGIDVPSISSQSLPQEENEEQGG